MSEARDDLLHIEYVLRERGIGSDGDGAVKLVTLLLYGTDDLREALGKAEIKAAA